MPFAVVKRHEVFYNGPHHHVSLVLQAHARTVGAAGGDHCFACFTERISHITIECYGHEAVQSILCGIGPIQPHPERWNLGLRDHESWGHVPARQYLMSEFDCIEYEYNVQEYVVTAALWCPVMSWFWSLRHECEVIVHLPEVHNNWNNDSCHLQCQCFQSQVDAAPSILHRI